MNIELAIAALGWSVLAFGHTTIGLRRVLPNLTQESLPSTPFGLAWAPDADPRTRLLRWFAALSLAATAQACWQARRRPSRLLRRPAPWVFGGDCVDVLDSIHVSPDRFVSPGRGRRREVHE